MSGYQKACNLFDNRTFGNKSLFTSRIMFEFEDFVRREYGYSKDAREPEK